MPTQGTSIRELSLDARLSYETLRRNAELLGSVSASFTREAREASDAYRDALTTSTPDAWTHFVETADALVRHTQSVASVVPLSPNERQAYAFFEQIAGENADLFQSQTPALA
jgi:hypothetical protein